MTENMNIDELLNAYLDDELSPRQNTEVKRLLDHDESIARRYYQLSAAKDLVQNLPPEDAPETLLQDIKSVLERKTLLEDTPGESLEVKGKINLFIRKTLSAAAVITMLAGLAYVIYQIIEPAPVQPTPIAADIEKESQLPEPAYVEKITKKTAQTLSSPLGFQGSLSIASVDDIKINSIITQAIKSGAIKASLKPDLENGRTVYDMKLSYEQLLTIAAEMAPLWQKVTHSELSFSSGSENMTINSVKPDQLLEIVQINKTEKRAKAAKYYSVLNKMTEARKLPTAEITPDQLKIPEPVIASGKALENPQDSAGIDTSENNIELKIIVKRNIEQGSSNAQRK